MSYYHGGGFRFPNSSFPPPRSAQPSGSRSSRWGAWGESSLAGSNLGVRPPSRMPSNVPLNFHEYHWRSTFETESVASRTSTYAGGSGLGGDQEDGFGQRTPTRNWEHTNLGSLVHSSRKNDTTAVGGGGIQFTLMSYNILGPGLLEKHSEIYTSNDQATLDWEFRLKLIYEEVENYKPDIVCFQEMEVGQYEMEFEGKFSAVGYRGVFKKKTGDKDDGCAIFFRMSTFLLVDKLEIEFMQPHVPLLNRDNVGLLVKLETKALPKRQKLVVGTTHLLFNPKRQDVKMAQAQLLLAELDRFAFSGFDKDGNCLYYPILMTGDFNCKPDSSVTRLLGDGQLQYLDENGDLIRLLKRKGSDTVLPFHCGITDQCQHYKIVLERHKKWKALKRNNFELDLRSQESLVNLYPYKESGGSATSTCLLSPPDELISLMSPVTEGVEPAASFTSAADSQMFAKAAQKMAALHSQIQRSSSSNTSINNIKSDESMAYDIAPLLPFIEKPEQLDERVLHELQKLGLHFSFGSGKLTHTFLFRDVHVPRLDRVERDAAVTTRQYGWVCVDYIFQSMTFNPSFNKRVEGKLKLIRRLGLLSRNQCKELGTIPNAQHPSDHFPLIAEFLLRQ